VSLLQEAKFAKPVVANLLRGSVFALYTVFTR